MDKAAALLSGRPRACLNYSVVLAAYSLMIDETDELGFGPWVAKKCADLSGISDQTRIQDQFLEDLSLLRSQGRIKTETHYQIKNGKIYLALRQVYDEWLKDRPDRGRALPGYNSIKALLLKEGCCSWAKSHRIGSAVLRCMVIDLSSASCPECVTALAEGPTSPYQSGPATPSMF